MEKEKAKLQKKRIVIPGASVPSHPQKIILSAPSQPREEKKTQQKDTAGQTKKPSSPLEKILSTLPLSKLPETPESHNHISVTLPKQTNNEDHQEKERKNAKERAAYSLAQLAKVTSSPPLAKATEIQDEANLPRNVQPEPPAAQLELEKIIPESQLAEPVDRSEDLDKLFSSRSMVNYFCLKRNPFGDSLDTTFFYKSRCHNTALTKMSISIEQDISFGLIYGKSGTGKTLLSQAILEKLSRKRFLPILVPVTPGFSRSAFLKVLLKGFGYSIANINRDINSMIAILENCILSYYKSGIKPVIMIDECHFLSSQALHILRTLTNFEAFHKKLITCLLFAEETFMRRLKNPYYASLRNRIYLETELPSLNKQECIDYIKFRLMIAGNEKANFFTEEQLHEIFKKSQGIPRNINKECTKIMIDRYF